MLNQRGQRPPCLRIEVRAGLHDCLIHLTALKCPHPNLLPLGRRNHLSPVGEGWGEGFRLLQLLIELAGEIPAVVSQIFAPRQCGPISALAITSDSRPDQDIHSPKR